MSEKYRTWYRAAVNPDALPDARCHGNFGNGVSAGPVQQVSCRSKPTYHLMICSRRTGTLNMEDCHARKASDTEYLMHGCHECLDSGSDRILTPLIFGRFLCGLFICVKCAETSHIQVCYAGSTCLLLRVARRVENVSIDHRCSDHFRRVELNNFFSLPL